MRDHMGRVGAQKLALLLRLPGHGFVGDDDIAKERLVLKRAGSWERQDVRRLVLAPPLGVERPDRRIIAECDAKLTLRRESGAACGKTLTNALFREIFQIYDPPPGRRRNINVDLQSQASPRGCLLARAARS